MTSMLFAVNPSTTTKEQSLPAFSHVLDTEHIKTVAKEWSLFAGAADRVDTALQYIRYKPERRCIALHRVTSSNEKSTDENFIVAKAMTELGFRKQHTALQRLGGSGRAWFADHQHLAIYSQFPLDVRLPTVKKVYDGDSQNRVLKRIIGANQGWSLHRFQRLAYKPERRFVILVIDSDGNEMAVKMHSRERFSDAALRLRLLEQAGLEVPKVANVCGRYCAVALEYLPGQSLSDLLACESDCEGVLDTVAAKLARIHKRTSELSWVGHLPEPTDRLSDLADNLRVLSIDLGHRAERTVTNILRRLHSTTASKTICHGDFYAKQVLVADNDVRLIDFDQAGPADRYGDVANFVAQLYWRHLLGDFGMERFERSVDVFLAGYRDTFAEFDDERYRAQLAAALVRCSMHPFRHAMSNWEEATASFLSFADSMLNSSTSV